MHSFGSPWLHRIEDYWKWLTSCRRKVHIAAGCTLLRIFFLCVIMLSRICCLLWWPFVFHYFGGQTKCRLPSVSQLWKDTSESGFSMCSIVDFHGCMALLYGPETSGSEPRPDNLMTVSVSFTQRTESQLNHELVNDQNSRALDLDIEDFRLAVNFPIPMSPIAGAKHTPHRELKKTRPWRFRYT